MRPQVQCGAILLLLSSCKLTFDCVHSEDSKPEEEQDCCGVELHLCGFCFKAEQKLSTVSPLSQGLYIVILWSVLVFIFMVSWRA